MTMQIIGVTGFVVQFLREEIITEGIGSGTKINEMQISQRLDISRAPIREALRILESEGFLINSPRKGSYVKDISLDDFNEIYQIREMIECKAIDLLREKKSKELIQVDAINKEIARLIQPSPVDSPKDFLAYISKRLDYHLKLVEMAGNKRLYVIYKNIRHNVLRYHFFSQFVQPESLKKSEIEHRQILKLIHNGNYQKAKIALKSHLRSHKEKVMKRIERRVVEKIQD